MPIRHVVARGESIESIAYAHGLFWQTVWDAPENAGLRERREHPNLLAPGDEVYVPDRVVKAVFRPTNQTHLFRRRGVPSRLRVQLREAGEPRAGLAYVVTGGAASIHGETDADGWIDCWLMPDIREGMVELPETGEQFEFEIGTVGPSNMLPGVQARLANLGYYHGELDGELGPPTIAALQAFQAAHGLEVTGQADDPTIAALVEAHRS